MTIRFLLACLALSLPTLAKEPPYLSGLEVKQKGLSSELEVMVEQLSTSKALKLKEAKDLADAMKVANADLSKAPKANALFLIKSEIYKSLLGSSFLPHRSRLSFSTGLLKSVEAKLKKHKLIYAPFSQWVIASVLSELDPFRKDGFIDKYQSVSGNDIKTRTRALELNRLSRYLGPWIIEFLDKTPEQFNQLTDQIAGETVKALARKGFYFAKFADDFSSSMGEDIFSVPVVAVKKSSKTDGAQDMGLEELKKERLQKGEKDVEKVVPTKDDPSSAIDQLIESSDKDGPNSDKNAWKPR